MVDQNVNITLKINDLASKGLKKVGNNLKTMGTKIQSTSAKFATLGTAAAGAITGAALKSILSGTIALEKSLGNLRAISGATADEFNDLKKASLSLGATTKFTAKEAAEGMTFLAMAGLETTEILAAIPGVLDLAAAGAIDLATAADISTNVLGGFRAEVKELPRFLDVMAKTATSSNTDIVEMGEAMKFAAPSANLLGVSVEETAAAIGILANAGIKGTSAGTGLQKLMIRLAKPTKEVTKGLEALNVTAFDAEGTFVGLGNVLSQIQDGMKGMSQQQRAANLGMVAGAIGLKSLANLAGSAGKEFEGFTEELKNAEGAAAAMAAIQLDNIAGDFTLLTSAIDGLKIAIGDSLIPSTREFLGDFLTPTISKMTEWTKANPGLTAGIVKWTTAIVGVTVAMGGIGLILPSLIAGFSLLATPIGVLIGTISGLKLAWETNFLGIQDSMNTFTDITSDWLLFFSRGVKDAFIGMFDLSKNIFSEMLVMFSKFTDDWSSALLFFSKGVKDAFVGMWNVVKDITFFTVGAMSLAWENNFLAIKSSMDTFTNVLSDWLLFISRGVVDAFNGMWEMAKNITVATFKSIKSSMATFSDVWSTWLLFISRGIKDTFIGIGNAINISVEFMNTILENFTDAISETFKNMWSFVLDGFDKFGIDLIASVKRITSIVTDLFSKMIGAVKRFSSSAIDIGKSVVSNFGGKITGALGFAEGGIVPKVQGFANGGIASSDTVPAMLTPGELILNAAQQKGLAKGMGGVTVVVKDNNFYGDDRSFAQRVGNAIIKEVRQNTSMPSFQFTSQ